MLIAENPRYALRRDREKMPRTTIDEAPGMIGRVGHGERELSPLEIARSRVSGINSSRNPC